MASVVGDGNEWIVDPHPLEWYGEAIYTSAEVLAMFPGVKQIKMVLSSCVNVGLDCTRDLYPLDRS
ncbi:hypothetical protein Hanom_Chr08g00755981 [Helianthus anomalus]